MSVRKTATKSPVRRNRRMRRAKVAHLPSAIRAEIVARIVDGHSQNAVLKWLNGNASVKAALRREKSGRVKCEVSSQNLSSWLHSNPPEAASLNLR